MFSSLYLINPKGLPFSSVSFFCRWMKSGTWPLPKASDVDGLLLWNSRKHLAFRSLTLSLRMAYLCSAHLSCKCLFVLTVKKKTGFYSKKSSENKNPEGLWSVRIIRPSQF